MSNTISPHTRTMLQDVIDQANAGKFKPNPWASQFLDQHAERLDNYGEKMYVTKRQAEIIKDLYDQAHGVKKAR